MDKNPKFYNDKELTSKPYREVAGNLLNLSTISRPDTVYCVWYAQKQKFTAISSAEAKYYAAGWGIQEGYWICRTMEEFKIKDMSDQIDLTTAKFNAHNINMEGILQPKQLNINIKNTNCNNFIFTVF